MGKSAPRNQAFEIATVREPDQRRHQILIDSHPGENHQNREFKPSRLQKFPGSIEAASHTRQATPDAWDCLGLLCARSRSEPGQGESVSLKKIGGADYPHYEAAVENKVEHEQMLLCICFTPSRQNHHSKLHHCDEYEHCIERDYRSLDCRAVPDDKDNRRNTRRKEEAEKKHRSR